MTYVDESVHRFGRMVMCHLVADSLDELHRMADTIGVARRWFQRSKNGVPHYDIAKSKRVLAVAAGAVEVDRWEMYRLIRYWRDYEQGPPRPQFCRLPDQPSMQELIRAEYAN